ncbi:glycosyltransferase [Paenibacillus sp. FSL H8-0034]|uniref:glycosyltransferase n=1 Tax=Paenibacillus sp. FSL H8-0034 TaxID=2954671 RepID=UPI0030F79858
MKKRILWLLNHDTLSKFELPLMRDLGFEIYTPKVVPKNILQQSGSVTYEYDNTLTIPQHDLQMLNEYNFYMNEDMPFIIRNIINKHFDIVIVMFDFYALNKIIDNFQGYIFARAFGLGDAHTYYDITKDVFGEDYFFKMEQIKDRFWFSHCYENIADIEKGIYKEKAVFMPLGLPDDFYTVENQWTGATDKVLFFCTRIKFNAVSGEIYQKFKKDFKGFDYIVAGNQPVPVDDVRVTGYLEREDINDLFRKCKVMYYHSTYPRHLHYHPLEAMIAGMPVVYMKGGALSILGGERQSGCCKDITEARKKVERILNGDIKLIEEIKEDQKEILYKFSYEFNKKAWEDNFLPIVNSLLEEKNPPKKVAIFISDKQPQYYLAERIEMINMINSGLKEVDSLNSIILNVPLNQINVEKDFVDLVDSGVSIREYQLEAMSIANTSDSLALMFKQEPLWYGEYILPTDYTHNNIEADYWLFLNDNIDKPIVPLKPYGIYVDNIGDRYYQAISNVAISNYKNASFILTCFESTKHDLVTHLGIKEEKILMIPNVFSKSNAHNNFNMKKEYILIEVDLNKFESITKILSEISDYYSLYRAEEVIKIHINNCSKEQQNSDEIYYINNIIKNSKLLNKYVTVHVDLRVDEYASLYAHAKKIIIPHNVSNITNKLAKAAFFSKRVILEELPHYIEFETLVRYKFEYKKFISNKNALLEVLTDISEFHPSKVEIPAYSVEEMSRVWRMLL